VLELHRRFRVKAVYFDPYQMQASAQRLVKAGVKMVEYPQSSPNLTAASQHLYELISGRHLIVYPDAAIRLAISRAIAVETARGWRISKDKQSHKIDVVVALAMAAYAALHTPKGYDTLPCNGSMAPRCRRMSPASRPMSIAPLLPSCRPAPPVPPHQHRGGPDMTGIILNRAPADDDPTVRPGEIVRVPPPGPRAPGATVACVTAAPPCSIIRSSLASCVPWSEEPHAPAAIRSIICPASTMTSPTQSPACRWAYRRDAVCRGSVPPTLSTGNARGATPS
jgi:hypothetical protein